MRRPKDPDRAGRTKTSGGLVHKTIYFDPDEWLRLQRESEREGLSASALVRSLVREYLGLSPIEIRRGPKGKK